MTHTIEGEEFAAGAPLLEDKMHQATAGTIERRQAGSARMAFDAQVDVGAESMPAFEANAIDVSREGLHLISPVLPELGQPLSCRFSVGDSEVICEGNVVWRMENANGGGHEFGIRFTALDSESAQILSELLAGQSAAPLPRAPQTQPAVEHTSRGARVRLHIDGLGAPMRARVRDAREGTLQAQSELGFLQIGKELELEDASTGQKRCARIDQVDVELDPNTGVPQLVVNLAYTEGAPAELGSDTDPQQALPVSAAPKTQIAAEAVAAPIAPVAAQAIASDELAVDPEVAEESARMKGQFATTMAKITPAVMAKSQKVYAAMRAMWTKRRETAATAAPRRTTAPAPGGGVVSKARRVARGPNAAPIAAEAPATPKDNALAFAKTHKRKLAAGGAITAAALLAGLALGQPSEERPLASAPVQDTPAAAQVAPAQAAPVQAAPVQAAPVQAAPIAQAQQPAAMNPSELPLSGNSGAMDEIAEDDLANQGRVSSTQSTRPKRVARPFGRGKIEHGKAFRLKMDGPIEDLQGAQLPEGFLVTMPDRRSLEGAAALFKADPRVAKAKVDNTSHGAELEVTFKDGTPAFVARARGDVLEVVLSNPGQQDGKDNKKQSEKATAKGRSNDGKNERRAESHKDKGGLERTSLKSRRKR